MFHFPWFALSDPMYSGRSTAAIHRGGFPHSDISGSTLGWQLPGAFRSHPRPSSPLEHLGIHHTPLVAYLPQSLVVTARLRGGGLSKLETKVQAPALRGGPERMHCLTLSVTRSRSDELSQQKLIFYPSYALFKERSGADCSGKTLWS